MISHLFRSAGLRATACAVVLASTAACGRFYNHNPDDGEGNADAVVVFANQSLDAADVFALVPGANATRLGSVMAGRTDTLIVPHEIIYGGSVNIVARLLARSYSPSSGPVSLRPGDALDIRLGLDDKYLTVLPFRP